jgi:hypothetical protein
MSGHPASFDAPAPKMKTVLLIFVPNLAPHRAPHSAGLLSRSRRPGRIWMYGASRNAKFPEGWPHELVAGHPPREKRAESRSQRGYRPTAIRIRRSTTRLSRLSFSSRAVAVPSGVSGSITAPRSRKWSSQRWCRGWKNLTSAPLRGSTVPMSLPFHALHRMQAYARLPASDDPPCLRLMTWSI